jgi:hypothetical protein
MAIKLDNMFDIQNPEGLEGLGTLNFLGGMPGTLTNIANVVAQQGSQLGPDEFGSYVIPASDPTYSTGFQYARSIAGGIPMSQVIAPGVSYSPEQPGGYTQAQLNTLVGTTPVETPPPPPPPAQEPDDPRYFGTGIGGVRIPVDRDMKMPPLRDIFGTNISNLSNLVDLTKINKNLQLMSQKAKEAGITGTDGVDLTGESLRRAYDEGRGVLQNMRGPFDIDQEAIDRIVQERIAERMPTIEQPDLSGFARLEDIPQIPTREDFLSIAREGIDIPMPQQPDISKFVTQEDIQKAIAGIDIPTYQAPDLSPYDLRLAELEQQLAGLKQPTGGSFSISQPAPRGLF